MPSTALTWAWDLTISGHYCSPGCQQLWPLRNHFGWQAQKPLVQGHPKAGHQAQEGQLATFRIGSDMLESPREAWHLPHTEPRAKIPRCQNL